MRFELVPDQAPRFETSRDRAMVAFDLSKATMKGRKVTLRESSTRWEW